MIGGVVLLIAAGVIIAGFVYSKPPPNTETYTRHRWWLPSTAEMVDRIVDNRGGVCNQCENEYQSLAQHWSMSQSCDYPPLSNHQRDIVRGLMLGDGSLDSNELAYLRCTSMRKDHLQWLAEELGWFVRAVTLESDTTYRLRTMSHPHFDHYWTWMDAPSTDYTLPPTAARVWYACDGTVSFGGTSDIPQLTFAASADAKRDALAELLSQHGFEPMIWDRRVALPRHQTVRWLY